LRLIGYGNMISFGHAVYIGIGAYTVGIFAYYEIYDGFIQWPVGLAVSALVALVFGAISLRTRGVYFIMITLALAQMVYFLGVSVDEYGADDGLVIDVRSEFAGLVDLEEGIALYYVVFVFLLLTIFAVHRLVNSRFGVVIRGAKSNEARLHALGFPVYRYKLTGFVIAGVICGLAGLLLGNFTNFVNPDMMHWTRSGELIFMVVLGGLGSLFGPVLGAFVFLLLEELLSDFTTHWQIIFGPFLVLVVLFLRGGIDSLLGRRSDG
jgi:branched-chain amino acid transport system permease protein